MTCVCALVEKGVVYMAADSAGVAGLSITIRKDEKVFTNGPFLISFTSSYRMGQLLRYKFDPPKQTINQDDMTYMVTDFIDAARRCFSANGFGDKDATSAGTFLVGYKGNIYTIQSDYQVGLTTDTYDAVGCGADLALGSLHSTAGKKPKERLKMALDAASHFNAGVHAPFLFLEQAPFKQPKK